MSRALLACPFVGKDTPSQSSEFAAADIRIMATAFAYNYQGLRIADIVNLVRELKSGLKSGSGKLSERQEYVTFQGWLEAAALQGDAAAQAARRIPSLDLFPVGDADAIHQLQTAICRVPAVIATHLKNHAFKKTSSAQVEQVGRVGHCQMIKISSTFSTS